MNVTCCDRHHSRRVHSLQWWHRYAVIHCIHSKFFGLAGEASDSKRGWSKRPIHGTVLQGQEQRKQRRQVPEDAYEEHYFKTSAEFVSLEAESMQRGSYLNAIDMFEWPFTEVLGRFLTVSFPLFFSSHHAFVLTITLAIPLLPSQVKWLLHVPWTVIGLSISWKKFTLMEASIPHASSFLTLINTWPGNQSTY